MGKETLHGAVEKCIRVSGCSDRKCWIDLEFAVTQLHLRGKRHEIQLRMSLRLKLHEE